MIKPLNDLPYIANLAKANLNRVVRLKYTRNYRKNDSKEVIASIKDVNERFGFIEFGHPMNINDNTVYAGTIGLYYDYKDGSSSADDIEITFINENLFNNWKYQYNDFHNKIIEEKGYDFCEESNNLTY